MISRLLRLCILLAPLCALQACASLPGRSDPGQRKSAVHGYDFSYQINNGSAVGLVQVFDGGHKTYFQFRKLNLQHVPVIWSVHTDGNKRALPLAADSPYLVVHQLARKFLVSNGGQEATVVMVDWAQRHLYTPVRVAQSIRRGHAPAPVRRHAQEASGAQCENTPPVGQPKTIDVPFIWTRTKPTTQADRDLEAIAKKLANDGQIVVRGRPSPGGGFAQARSRARAIKHLLVLGGVPPSHIRIQVTGVPKPGPMHGLYMSQIQYGAPSSGFVVLDGC